MLNSSFLLFFLHIQYAEFFQKEYKKKKPRGGISWRDYFNSIATIKKENFIFHIS